MGFAPTERDVELPFVAFYRFDNNGKLTSERNSSEPTARIWRMASETPTEGLVVVDMGDVQVVARPASFEGPPDSVADSSKAARWSFSFSVSEAALLAGLQADFLRPL